MLSICIIVKNEEKNINRCLELLSGTGFEIIVVDTGSTDRTKEIALDYTSKVYDFEWCDDFAAAKNFAISKASQSYVMVLDSDEFLKQIDVKMLKKQIQFHPSEVGRICRINVFTRDGRKQENMEWLNRIFPREKYEYKGRIHEQVTAVSGRSYKTYETSVVIEHTGYDLPIKERQEKAERNMVLLKQELVDLQNSLKENQPEDSKVVEQIPYILYQLGKSCYMAEDYKTACDYFAKGLSYDLNPKLEYVIDMVETYGYALINSGQAETALFFENIYAEFGNCADFCFLMGLIYMNNARFEEAVREFLKATRYDECRSKGVNNSAAYYNIGVIYECLGKVALAKEYYQKCGTYPLAVERVEHL